MEIMRQLIINMDPPDHVKYRRVVRNAFTTKAADMLEPLMREFAKNIIDTVAPGGECEFVSEVSTEMPLFVICALMEMPAANHKADPQGGNLCSASSTRGNLGVCAAGY